jgi:hypothetical protein
MESGFKADMYPVGRDVLHLWGMARRRRVEFAGEPVMLAPAEYVIVRKLEYFREGGSEKHLRDIAGMRRVSAARIDEDAIRQWTARLGLQAQWEQAKATG